MIFDDFVRFRTFFLDFVIYAFFDPLGYLEPTRLEKLVRLLAARRQTDEYETSYNDVCFFPPKFVILALRRTVKQKSC